ncbi:TadE/TadG family type IV pilus assembly protein [Streptomyces sp. SLBN-31]|uniref:TadE/TadG family type IV pilus assembly protein n=1 Tax=Streptomyces sp. SLBN-31 TaxID=2768444 RepID=UPI0011547645|nr:TadE/TadG family type IV pilus assembly protein [Streptomyces sp. SLBN-31]TQJ89666.1 TadE-like protein [Streptomyces sp. SLBN-31]
MSYHRRRRDAGQVAIEYLGFLPVLLLVALAGVQLGLIAYAAQQAGTAARAGARAASLQQAAGAACAQAVNLDATCESADLGTEVRVTSHVTIPVLFPGLGRYEASKTAVMPLDH